MKEHIIYLRTSTKLQETENQLPNCLSLSKELNLECEVLSEQTSAFKDSAKRIIFDSIKKEITSNKIKTIIVWDLDRIYRNRMLLLSFFELCKLHNCKIYSFRQKFLEDIYKSPAPWNEMLYNMMLFILGWIAEDESVKRSGRIKNAVRIVDGVTKSRKGNKWGRKDKLNEDNKKEILILYNKLKSMQKTAVKYNKLHKPYITYGTVFNVIKESKR